MQTQSGSSPQEGIEVYDPVLDTIPPRRLEELVLIAGAWLDLSIREGATERGRLAGRAYSDCQTLLNELLRLRRGQGMTTTVATEAVRAAAKDLF